MELNVNSPAYYTQQYGVNESVCSYSQKCHEYFKDKEYSETLKIIGICPQCAPKDLYQQGRWKEGVRFIGNASCASVNVRMDFDEYRNATDKEKILMIRNAILEAVKKVRTKGKFDHERFSWDLQEMTETDFS